MNSIFYVTGNTAKFLEVDTFLRGFNVPFNLEQHKVSFTEIQSLNQSEIAQDKAEQAWNYLKHPLLIDDAGFYFKKYPLFPGALSKPIIKAIGWKGLVDFAQVHGDEIVHYMHMIYVNGNNSYKVFNTICNGRLIKTPRYSEGLSLEGLNGYAYFLPDGSDKTYAQLYGKAGFEEFSYRQQAIKQFLEWYQEYEKNNLLCNGKSGQI